MMRQCVWRDARAGVRTWGTSLAMRRDVLADCSAGLITAEHPAAIAPTRGPLQTSVSPHVRIAGQLTRAVRAGSSRGR